MQASCRQAAGVPSLTLRPACCPLPLLCSIFKPQFQGAAAAPPPLPPLPGSSSSSENGSLTSGLPTADPGVAAARWFLTGVWWAVVSRPSLLVTCVGRGHVWLLGRGRSAQNGCHVDVMRHCCAWHAPFHADRIATLREAFRRTPKWLGFNIEVLPVGLLLCALCAAAGCKVRSVSVACDWGGLSCLFCPCSLPATAQVPNHH